MLETKLRPAYQTYLVDPAAARLSKYLSPNAVTLMSLVSGLAAAVCIAYGFVWPAFALLLLSGWLDTLDGTIARLSDRSSPIGTAYDILADRCVEWAIVMGLFLYDPTRATWCLIMMGAILIVVSTFLVAGIFMENHSAKGFHYSPGLMERAEAFIFFTLMIFFPAGFSVLAGLFTLLVIYTALVRIHEIIQLVKIPS